MNRPQQVDPRAIDQRIGGVIGVLGVAVLAWALLKKPAAATTVV